MYSRKQFDKDVQKLRELIKACEELEVNNRNYTNSIHFEKSNQRVEVLQVMRTLTAKEYEVIKQIYNSTDEIEANLSFQFGIQNDTYYQLFHSYSEGEK